MKLKPSHFTCYPWNSVLQKAEAEIVICNIMKILSRLENEFRQLSWNQYKEEKLKDRDFSENEHDYFNEVILYCKDSDSVMSFSKEWKLIGENFNN